MVFEKDVREKLFFSRFRCIRVIESLERVRCFRSLERIGK